MYLLCSSLTSTVTEREGNEEPQKPAQSFASPAFHFISALHEVWLPQYSATTGFCTPLRKGSGLANNLLNIGIFDYSRYVCAVALVL